MLNIVFDYYIQKYTFINQDFYSRSVNKLHDANYIYQLSHPSFNRTDADVVFWVVTQGSVQYIMPVDDPLFLSHRKVHPTLNLQSEKNMDGYFPSNNLYVFQPPMRVPYSEAFAVGF